MLTFLMILLAAVFMPVDPVQRGLCVLALVQLIMAIKEMMR